MHFGRYGADGLRRDPFRPLSALISPRIGASATAACSLGSGHDFAAAARGQGGEDGCRGVVEKADGAIGEEEMGAADMQAPEVEHIALIVDAAGSEGIRSGRARTRLHRQDILLLDAEDKLGRAGIALADAGVPPTVLEIGAGRPLPGEERVARAVLDIDNADVRIAKQDAVLGPQILPLPGNG